MAFVPDLFSDSFFGRAAQVLSAGVRGGGRRYIVGWGNRGTFLWIDSCATAEGIVSLDDQGAIGGHLKRISSTNQRGATRRATINC